MSVNFSDRWGLALEDSIAALNFTGGIMGHHAFTFEHLEGRALFSMVAPHVVPMPYTSATLAALLAKVKHPHPIQDAFNVAGTFTHDIHVGNPDAGTPYEFTGTGKSAKLGTFTLTGWIQPPGFIANGQAHGKLFLTNSQGSVILSVIGPPQGSGVLPSSLSFTIIQGHGAYLHAKGTGQILVSASDTTQKFVFHFNQSA
jgi:hypothetical protein